MTEGQRVNELEAEVERLTTENMVLKAKLEEAQIELQARRAWDAGPSVN